MGHHSGVVAVATNWGVDPLTRAWSPAPLVCLPSEKGLSWHHLLSDCMAWSLASMTKGTQPCCLCFHGARILSALAWCRLLT